MPAIMMMKAMKAGNLASEQCSALFFYCVGYARMPIIQGLSQMIGQLGYASTSF